MAGYFKCFQFLKNAQIKELLTKKWPCRETFCHIWSRVFKEESRHLNKEEIFVLPNSLFLKGVGEGKKEEEKQ